MTISPEQFETISKWGFKKIILYLIALLFFSSGAWYGVAWIWENIVNSDYVYNQNSLKGQNSVDSNTDIISGSVLGETDSKKNAGDIENKFNEKDWEIDKKRIEKEVGDKNQSDEFFCVKDSKIFDSAVIWYKEKIPLGTTFKLRYVLKNRNGFNENVPKLIFAFGDESTFRIFLPEDSENEFIGIEKVNSDKTRSRNHIRLINNIDSFRENIFEITIKNSNVNKASFLYNLKYFPLPKNNEEMAMKQIPDSDSFEEYLPWVDPGNIGFKQPVGVGVFNNVCIKIISATWSNLQ